MANFRRSMALANDTEIIPLRAGNAPTLTRAANQGWTASVTLAADPGAGPYRFHLKQQDMDTGEITELWSPEMVMIDGAKKALAGHNKDRGNIQFELQLMDQTMLKMAPPGQSFPTFRNSTAKGILSEIASWAGVKIEGGDDWPISLEEIKQQKPIDGFRRILAAGGEDFQVLANGKITRYRATTSLGPCSRQIVMPGYSEGLGNRLNLVTGLRVERQSPMTGDFTRRFETSDVYSFALPTPMGSCVVRDISSSGYIDQICLWNGDPKKNGTLLQFFSSLTGPPNIPIGGAPPITHVSLSVYASVIGTVTGEEVDAAVRVIGTPWNPGASPGVVPAFSVFIGSTTWPAEQPWSEPLIPSAAFAQAREKDYVWQRNKGNKPASGAFSRQVLDAAPGQWIKPTIYGSEWSKVRLDSVTHTVNQTTWAGHVITYTE